MIVSLNKIITHFKTFAEQHPAINSFIEDEVEDFTSNNHSYPLLWVADDQLNIVPSFCKFTIIIMFLDRVADNITERFVRSDLAHVVEEFITEFSSENYDIYNFEIDYNSVSATPIHDKDLSDKVTGYRISLIVNVFSSKNLESVPQ